MMHCMNDIKFASPYSSARITTVRELQHKSLPTKRNYYKLIRYVRTLNTKCVLGYVVSASGDL